jgi:hypothetical protein
MRLTPNTRRVVLVAHILGGVGWFGSVAAYLCLSLTGLLTLDPKLAQACYLAMDVIGWRVVVPLSGLVVLAGLTQAAGTAWGLARHWWVFLKLLMTILAAGALLMHMRPTTVLAAAARAGVLNDPELRGLQLELVLAPSLAILLLGFNAALGVVKPKGLTPFANP